MVGGGNKGFILLVDDEPEILKVLSYDLEYAGYKVDTALSGDEALPQYEEKRHDLVITDLKMPGMDGVSFLREVKKVDPEAFVMMLTGYGIFDTAVDALRLGATDFLIKPYQRGELLLRVSNCFEKMELKQKIKLYEKILPICCVCKKIRDDSQTAPGKGRWVNYEMYLTEKSDLELSHGYCQDCLINIEKNME